MIFQESRLAIVDNSGAKEVLCIKVLGHTVGYVGARLIVTIKRAIHKRVKKKKIIKKGEIHRVLLLSCRKGWYRKNGHRVAGTHNYGIILRRDNPTIPFGSRFRFPIFREIRAMYSKVFIMCPNVI